MFFLKSYTTGTVLSNLSKQPFYINENANKYIVKDNSDYIKDNSKYLNISDTKLFLLSDAENIKNV